MRTQDYGFVSEPRTEERRHNAIFYIAVAWLAWGLAVLYWTVLHEPPAVRPLQVKPGQHIGIMERGHCVALRSGAPYVNPELCVLPARAVPKTYPHVEGDELIFSPVWKSEPWYINRRGRCVPMQAGKHYAAIAKLCAPAHYVKIPDPTASNH